MPRPRQARRQREGNVRAQDKRRRVYRRARKSKHVVLDWAMGAPHSVAATAPIGWLVVDAGATKGAVGCAREFREQAPNTWFRAASSKTVGDALDAGLPLVPREASGEDSLRRSTWSVADAGRPGGVPFLPNRSRAANLHMVTDLGAGSLVVKTSSGKPVVLATGVRGGHLVLPTHSWGQGGNPGTAGATCGPKSAVRASQVPRRAHAQGRPD